MPCQARLDAPGTLHHVIIRGIEQQAMGAGNGNKVLTWIYLFGRKSSSLGNLAFASPTFFEAIIKVEDRIQRDEELAERVDLLEKNLIRKGKKKYLISAA